VDAHVAQLVEHVLGKDGVTSSNLVVGFEKRFCFIKAIGGKRNGEGKV
jgi:hypothetical protein